MLLSMTGYGRVSQSFRDKTILVEIRSLNSKFTDLRLKIPSNYREKDTELRRTTLERLERGKIDMLIEVKSVAGGDGFGLNKPLFRRYYEELSALAGELKIDKGDIIQTILRIQNVVSSDEDSIDEEEWAEVLKVLDKATTQLTEYRRTEGKAMEDDMRVRVNNILGYLAGVDPFEKDRIPILRQRLHQNLEDHLGKDKIDESRFEQEILFYLEKMDITEEKVRLEQHCKYYLEEMSAKTSQGRKLSFISQEIGREINTLGAKAYSSDIQRLVVGMKDELEKIKEQVANLV